jgi:hypothetical protein
MELNKLKKGKKYIGKDDKIVKTLIFIGKQLVIFEYDVTYSPPGSGVCEMTVYLNEFLINNVPYRAKSKQCA